ncbi:hypothetical protein [Devosia sp.]|uniref:hypothetical protein n=1 Tax=Devosia sp. TaxID=1871048 RepID=UPI002619B710|nr:hypothetical protein [Devosia sp.]
MWNRTLSTALFFGLCLGVAPAMAQTTATTPPIDLSQAGTTPAENQAFVAAMTPEDQANVITACVPVIIAPDANTPPTVVSFCNAVSEAGVPAAGTTPEENMAFFNSLPAAQQENVKAACTPAASATPTGSTNPAMLLNFCQSVASP